MLLVIDKGDFTLNRPYVEYSLYILSAIRFSNFTSSKRMLANPGTNPLPDNLNG